MVSISTRQRFPTVTVSPTDLEHFLVFFAMRMLQFLRCGDVVFEICNGMLPSLKALLE